MQQGIAKKVPFISYGNLLQTISSQNVGLSYCSFVCQQMRNEIVLNGQLIYICWQLQRALNQRAQF